MTRLPREPTATMALLLADSTGVGHGCDHPGIDTRAWDGGRRQLGDPP